MSAVSVWLVGVFQRIYKPIKVMALEFWMEANIVLHAKESVDHAGRYKRGQAINAARLIDKFVNEEEWRTLVVMKSSQSGFTLHVLAWLLRVIIEAPVNILYVIDSDTKAKRLSKRIQRLFDGCKAMSLQLQDRSTKLNILEYDLPGCSFVLTGGQSANQVASDPYGIAVNDEMDKCKRPKKEAHIWELIISRIKAAADGLGIGFGTPTVETGMVNVGYESGSKHQYFVPCPLEGCGQIQTIDLEQLRYNHCLVGKGRYDLRRVLRETYLECKFCAGRIEERYKFEMLLAGDWQPTNFRIEIVNGIEAKVPDWVPGEMSARTSDLYSLHASSTWGQIIMEYIRAQLRPDKMQDVLNNRFGQPVRQSVTNIQEAHVLRLRGEYKRGTLPVDPAIVCMSIDNQGDHQKGVKYAFMPNGDMYIIDWWKSLAREETDDRFKENVPCPGGEAEVQRVIIDEGGKDGTSYEVRAFCLPRFPVYFPAKGRGGVQVRHTIAWSDSSVSKGGAEKIPVCHFDDDAFKRILYMDRIKKFDAQKSIDYGYPRLWLPTDVDEEFVRELCGEQLVKALGKYGVVQYVWEPKPPNDYGDCVKMGYVLWNIIEGEVKAANPPL